MVMVVLETLLVIQFSVKKQNKKTNYNGENIILLLGSVVKSTDRDTIWYWNLKNVH